MGAAEGSGAGVRVRGLYAGGSRARRPARCGVRTAEGLVAMVAAAVVAVAVAVIAVIPVAVPVPVVVVIAMVAVS